MSYAHQRAKADAESRQSEERKQAEKRRNLLVLCARFLADLGFIDSARQIESDTNISLDRLDVADNVDLPTILTEYEDFYEMRFGKKPKLVRKVSGFSDDKPEKKRGRQLERLPPVDGAQSSNECSGGSSGSNARPRERSHSVKRSQSEEPQRERRERGREKPPLAPDKGGQENGAEGNAAGGFDGLVGLGVAAAAAKGTDPKGGDDNKETEDRPGDDYYDNKLMRALPNYGADKEYRELAVAISRDILTRNPGVSWDSIVGLGHAKGLLKEAVVMPLKYPQLFTGLLTPWKGVLLFGPPGTGKTLLAKAVATECETTFFNISASTVVSKWRGDSEKLIRVLFDLARHHQPSTIFIDELDSLMSARGGGDSEHEGSRRMKTELLIQMDGLLRDSKDQVFLLAASNLPWDLDSAMLRRLEKRILVNLPSHEARESMFRVHLSEGFAEHLDYSKLAGLTEEWSGSDIRLLCKEAAMHPLRRLMREIEAAEAAAKPEVKERRRGGNRQRAAEKAAAREQPIVVEDLQMGPVTEGDVERALQSVHRAPAAHTERYQEWQEQFGAA